MPWLSGPKQWPNFHRNLPVTALRSGETYRLLVGTRALHMAGTERWFGGAAARLGTLVWGILQPTKSLRDPLGRPTLRY